MNENERDELIKNWREALTSIADPKKAKVLSHYFKTGPGEYGEGDVFIGINVPDLRNAAREFGRTDVDTIFKMMDSPIHEFRVTAIVALTNLYSKSKDEAQRIEIADRYIANAHLVNNWDLVDISAPHILGGEILSGRAEKVEKLSTEPLLWHRRMAMVAQMTPIKHGMIDGAEHIANILMDDPHDLIRKAVGWMLRIIGDQDRERLNAILGANIHRISSVTLSYATEKLPIERRRQWRELRRASKKG